MFADGDHWAEQKRFTVKHMKTFGFGKSGHESIVQEEVTDDEMLSKIKIKKCCPVSVYVCRSGSRKPPCILKRGRLESSGQRIILLK